MHDKYFFYIYHNQKIILKLLEYCTVSWPVLGHVLSIYKAIREAVVGTSCLAHDTPIVMLSFRILNLDVTTGLFSSKNVGTRIAAKSSISIE